MISRYSFLAKTNAFSLNDTNAISFPASSNLLIKSRVAANKFTFNAPQQFVSVPRTIFTDTSKG